MNTLAIPGIIKKDNRRMTDPHLEQIKATLEEHKVIIEENTIGLSGLTEKVDPIYDIVIEFKGFSRFVARLKSIILWLVGLGASITALIEWFKHIKVE